MTSSSTKQLSAYFESNKAHLNSACREILFMVLQQKLSQKTIADRLNISVPKTKQKIARATLELRRISNDPDYIKAMQILKNK